MQTTMTWRAASRIRGLLRYLPPGVKLMLRRVFKAAFWLVTPHRLGDRIRFLRARKNSAASPPVEITPTVEVTPRWRFDHSRDVSGCHVVLLVTYCPSGRLSRLQVRLVDEWADAGYSVYLIVNSGDFWNDADPGENRSSIRMVRENIGFDFGAWCQAVSLIEGLHRATSVVFTNDSVVFRDGGVSTMRQLLLARESEVVFGTFNQEVKPHGQSYLFAATDPGRFAPALSELAALPDYTDKQALINEVEIGLADRFRGHDLTVAPLFTSPEAEASGRNPTIHHWRDLLDHGCPFLKIQLFSLGFLTPADPEVQAFLGPEIPAMLEEHLAERARPPSGGGVDVDAPPRPALPVPGLLNEHGAQQAYNPPEAWFPTLVLPFGGDDNAQAERPRILGVIHCFYVDVAQRILEEIAGLDIEMRLLLTTDTADKEASLRAALSRRGLAGDVIVCPNRGRDVAPFLIEGARHLGDAELVFHLHTKKSPHDRRYAGWGEYVRKNLIGSNKVVHSILALFAMPEVGLVYSDHHGEVAGLRNWGYDFEKCRNLLGRLGIPISADDLLEFPTSTMFWARREVLEPLFSLGLRYEDFDEEQGQVDGTLAHAIERSLLFLTEGRSFFHVKVVADEQAKQASGILMRLSISDLRYHMSKRVGRLTGGGHGRTRFYAAVPEIYPVSIARGELFAPRLTLLLPTAKPEKIYGGISSAVRCAAKLIERAPDVDLRVVITSDPVDRRSLTALSDLLSRPCTLVQPSEDVRGVSVVPLAERSHVPLAVRERDVFLATAWWTADLGFRIIDQRNRIFSTPAKQVYLIQDFECGFYPWSPKHSLAEATYGRPEDTIALINSEELANFMMKRYNFQDSYVLPYALNEKISSLLRPRKREKILLAYGRPSVERNCFAIVVEAIRLWQAMNPGENAGFRVIFAGEDFDRSLISEIENASVVGKLSIEDYAALLNRAALGLSLMVSPHPSYPPLEMASAGIQTVTNSHANKDLSRRASNIISVDMITPMAVAEALEAARTRLVFDQEVGPVKLERPEVEIPVLDFDRLAEQLFRT